MDCPTVVVIDCCAATDGKDSLADQIASVQGCESVTLPNALAAFKLRLDTKYYSADVTLCRVASVDCGFDSVDAILVHFDGRTPLDESFARAVDVWLPEVRVLSCEQVADETVLETIQKWCLQHEFELVELEPSQEDKEELLFCGEKIGIERILQILQSHTWANAELKDEQCSAPNRERLLELIQSGSVPSTAEEVASLEQKLAEVTVAEADCQATASTNRDLLLSESDKDLFERINAGDDPGADSFEALFERFKELKEHAQGMSGENRKLYAEQVTMAFWNAIGGDSAEIADLDE